MKLTHILLLAIFITVTLAVLTNGSAIGKRVEKEMVGNNRLTGKFYSIRGFRMYCEVYGKGEPLLLIHGNGGSIAAFKNQVPYFSKHYQVIVADSRSQGKSVDPSDSLTYEEMADDYAALLTALQIDSAFVIGWSDGGINGMLLAMRHPGKVKKLVITGANLKPDSTAIDAGFLNEMMLQYRQLKKEVATEHLKNDKTVQQFKLIRLMIEQPSIALTDLQKIAAPTLVIGGDHDLILPAHTLQIFQNLPNASLWILPHCGHASLIDYADEFNKKTDAFFMNNEFVSTSYQ